jgi:hypothetical protein
VTWALVTVQLDRGHCISRYGICYSQVRDFSGNGSIIEIQFDAQRG